MLLFATLLLNHCSSGKRLSPAAEDTSSTITVAASEKHSANKELQQLTKKLQFTPVVLPETSESPEPNQNIIYELQLPSHVRLTIFNFLGNPLRVLVDEKQAIGVYKLQWDGKDEQNNPLPNSIYFYQVSILNDEGEELYSEARRYVLIADKP